MDKDKSEKVKSAALSSAKECAYLAVFISVTVAAQLALGAVPGVELVTVLFVSYCCALGCRRGVASAVCFSLIRQFVFGFYPSVLVQYLIYYCLLAIVFGLLGKKQSPKFIPVIVTVACVCTFVFNLLDCVITPLWFGMDASSARAYFYASLPFTVPQIICTAVTVSILYYPLAKAFRYVYKGSTR